MIATLEACGDCSAACPAVTTPLLHVSGYAIVSATSSCNNVSAVLPGPDLGAWALSVEGECTYGVTLDDGETISLAVPFTKDAQACCCGHCSAVKAADFSLMTISAPPGYVRDAGTD